MPEPAISRFRGLRAIGRIPARRVQIAHLRPDALKFPLILRDDTPICNGRNAAPMRLLLSVLPVRRHVRARLVQMHVLVDMIDPRQRYEMMMLSVRRTLFGQLDLVGTFEMVDLAFFLSDEMTSMRSLICEVSVMFHLPEIIENVQRAIS
jgi:hypothetical protein